MLALTLQSCATLRSLAEHIDARGGHIRFTLYSVDLLPEQQYLDNKTIDHWFKQYDCIKINCFSMIKRLIDERGVVVD